MLKKGLSFLILLCFLVTSIIGAPPFGFAQFTSLSGGEMLLPAPGIMVHLSPEFTPAILKGIVIHPENAFKFDFIIYKGDKEFSQTQKKEEYTKLVKYFLASL